MGLFIHSLLIVMMVRSSAELQVAASGINQKTFSYEQDTRSKIDELKIIVSNYLEMVYTELRNTKHQVEELKVTVSDNQETVSSELEDTRRMVHELQVTVSGNQETISSELEDTRRKMDELQVAVSGNQKTVSSELEDTRRMVHELQVTVFGNQETISSELEDTRRKMDELQVAVSGIQETVSSDTRRQMAVMGRQVGELQESVSKLLNGVLQTQCQPQDCSDIYARGVTRSGVYEVEPLYSAGEPFLVYCDMETDGGGWTVFQRRKDGSVDFFLDFASYSRGFGNLEGEFWLGNDNLHRLTTQGEYELRVDLSDFENESRYAVYDSFSIANVSDNYRMTALGMYSGTAGDSLRYHNNIQFSTKDRDNDRDNGNCAQSKHGAWWYNRCHHSSLNGPYLRGTTTGDARGVIWYDWKRWHYSLKTSEMKIRPTAQ